MSAHRIFEITSLLNDGVQGVNQLDLSASFHFDIRNRQGIVVLERSVRFRGSDPVFLTISSFRSLQGIYAPNSANLSGVASSVSGFGSMGSGETS